MSPSEHKMLPLQMKQSFVAWLKSPKVILFLGFIFMVWFFHQFSEVMLPFIIALLLAYLSNPIVKLLMRMGVSRMVAVSIVFAFMFVGVGTLLLFSIPIIQDQISNLIALAPRIVNLSVIKINWILHYVGIHDVDVNSDSLKKMITDHLPASDKMATWAWQTTISSGRAFVTGLIEAVIIPFVTFYLLRDWNLIARRMNALIRKNFDPDTKKLIHDSEAALSDFFRGQFTVVLLMSVFYMATMSLSGLQVGIVIGLIMGILTILPYIGSIIGLGIACIAAIAQTGDYTPLVWVLLSYVVGHAIENFYLTPKFIGNKIGMHPILVIFAIIWGGSAFGIWGVILILPFSSVAIIVLKHFYQRFYLTDATESI